MCYLKIQIYSSIPFGNMFQSNIINSIITVLIFLLSNHIVAQDLRDFEHTQKFANFLFQSKQFTLASEEYERLVYYDSTNNNSRLKLIQSYRLSGKFNIALQKFDRFFKDSLLLLKNDFAEELVKNLILEKENQKAIGYIDSNINFDENTRQNYTLAAILLKKDWDMAFEYALKNRVTGNKKNADLHVIAFQSKQLKYKKPFVAAMFSSVIPGTGKFYTKNWKDGIISLMLVGVNTWQAYRGFHKYGEQSAYGWVFAGFATTFYIGNVFGSYRSAKKYNIKLNEELYNKTWHLVVDDF
jgi:hypothetical protein